MAPIQSAQVRYSTRLALGQYEHEELEVSLTSDANPSDEDLKELMRKAKKLCTINSSRSTKALPQPPVARANSVVVAPSRPVEPAFTPDPGFAPARPAVAPTKHPYAGYYYGYKLPWKVPAVEKALEYLKSQKQARWEPDSKTWWTKVVVDGWEKYLIYSAQAATPEAAPQAQPSLEFTPPERAAPNMEDDSDIPF